MRSKMLWCLVLVLLALPLAAQEETESFYGRIRGQVTYANSGYSPTPAIGATVKLCAYQNNPYSCRTQGTDGSGNFEFAANSYPTESGTLYLYVWSGNPWEASMWGSPDDLYDQFPACNYSDQFGCHSTGYDLPLTLFYRPLIPNLLSPANTQTNVPLTGVTLSWTDGLDTTRRQIAGYANNMYYDIYASGCCIAPTLYVSNVRCNGSNGVCYYSVPATLNPNTHYSWYVKARYLEQRPDRTIWLTRQSYTSSFTSAGSVVATYSFRTYYGFYLSATNCGGSSLNANGSTIGTCEKFRILDPNGGDLVDGDEIYIQASNGSYWSAVNGGGGAVNADSGQWQTFHIKKMNNNGQGPIASGDNIAISCSNGNFVVSEGGGYGGPINCNRTTPAQWETFGVNTWTY